MPDGSIPNGGGDADTMTDHSLRRFFRRPHVRCQRHGPIAIFACQGIDVETHEPGAFNPWLDGPTNGGVLVTIRVAEALRQSALHAIHWIDLDAPHSGPPKKRICLSDVRFTTGVVDAGARLMMATVAPDVACRTSQAPETAVE